MHSNTAPRRRHGAELKAKVLVECDQPDASIASIAQAHGLNANLVHKWRRRHRQRVRAIEACVGQDNVAEAFVPLRLAPSTAAVPDIRVELRRGATSVSIAWPDQAANECAAWLREWRAAIFGGDAATPPWVRARRLAASPAARQSGRSHGRVVERPHSWPLPQRLFSARRGRMGTRAMASPAC